MLDGNIVNELGDTILIKLEKPYTKVKKVLSYELEINTEDEYNYFSKYFRWSTDNKVFSEFVELTDINLQRLELNPQENFWIEYKFEAVELETARELEFVSIGLEVITDDGRIIRQIQGNLSTCNPDDPSCIGNLIVEDCCDDNTLSPYDWMKGGTKLFEQLSDLTTAIAGHCVKYYRVEPDLRSRDFVLKEDSLYTRSQVEEIKVLVPDNDFPSNEIEFDEMAGMMHEAFEIHLTRNEFEKAFGGGQRPRERDAIYFPANKRMYVVSSISLSDDMFDMYSYWRIYLRKWENLSNVYNTPEIEEDLTGLVRDIHSVGETEIHEEMEKITKPQQYYTVGILRNDKVREVVNLDEKIKIVDYNLNNNWTIVSRNYYDMTSVSPQVEVLKYRKEVDIKSSENRAFTFWFRNGLNKQYEGRSDILYGMNHNSEGMSIYLEDAEIVVQLNGDSFRFNHSINFKKDIWYSAVINLSNQFKQLSVTLYELDKNQTYSYPQAEDSLLDRVFNEVKNLNNAYEINSGDKWKLRGGNIHLTNLRIFDTPIEEESHNIVLNQFVVMDAHRALLIDNALNQLHLAKLENPR